VTATLETLIDKCAEICGTQRALAVRLGVKPPRLNDWKAHRLPAPVEVVAALAEMAQISGEEARRVLADAECRNPKHTDRAEALRRAFFGVLAAGVVLAGLSTTDSHAQSVDGDRLTLYTLCAQVRALFEALRRVRPAELRPWRASVLHRFRLGLPPPRRSSDCPRFAPP